MTATKTITASRIANALKARFSGRGGAQSALRALGLDADLLGPAPSVGGSGDAMKELRVALEQIMPKLGLNERATGKLLELLDEHCPMDRLDDDHPNKERAAAIAGNDEGDERRGKIGAFLRSKGLNESNVERALEIIDGANDMLPKNAMNGGFGGAIGAKRARSPMTADQRQAFRQLLVDRGFDDDEIQEIIGATAGALAGGMAGDAAIDAIETGMARISSPPSYAPERRHGVGVRGEASLQRMYGDDFTRIVTHA